MLHQYSKEFVVDFVFRFLVTCLKIADLVAVEKLDPFVRVLVLEIRLQVELRGPLNFHEIAMVAQCADAMISRVSSQTR